MVKQDSRPLTNEVSTKKPVKASIKLLQEASRKVQTSVVNDIFPREI